MTGLEIADLKDIHVLSHLPEEERSSIKFVHVYGSDRSSFDGLSALYLTTNDEVFLAGFDSLLGKSCKENVPTWHKGVLEKSVKVGDLSGKSVQRIVVGEEFGAALTKSKDLYLWGTDVGPGDVELPVGLSRLALESHYDGARCPRCLQKLRSYSLVPALSLCSKCGGFGNNRVSSLPSPTSWTGRPLAVLGYPATATTPPVSHMFCRKCGVLGEWTYYPVSNMKIASCSSCYQLFDGEQYLILPQNNPAPHKVIFPTPLPIVDIAAGKTFLIVQTTSQLIIWGDLGGQKHSCYIKNPDNVSFTKVACGSAHIAVITDQGDLYTCGVGEAGQLGYSWAATDGCVTLKKVTLKAPVVEVACGLKSTVCLIQNGVLIVYGNVNNIFTGSTFSLNLFESVLLCVPTFAFINNAQMMESATKKIRTQSVHGPTILTGDSTDVFIHLHGASVISPDGVHHQEPGFCACKECKPKRNQNRVNPEYQDDGSRNETELEKKLVGAESESPSHYQPSSNFADMFGQPLFSDLTLKLADGELPLHRLVLHRSSAYFRQILSDPNASAVLNMSSYNPSAYRGLLHYFYGVPLTQMNCEDMFDLYILANSYGEDWVATDVLSKLKSSITTDNVLLLLSKAKVANATDLLHECHEFINTPELKKSLWDRASQDTDAIVELLRYFSLPKN